MSGSSGTCTAGTPVSFSRTASGNFAFNFYVALLDEPDIKFDYDQQSYFHTQNP